MDRRRLTEVWSDNNFEYHALRKVLLILLKREPAASRIVFSPVSNSDGQCLFSSNLRHANFYRSRE